MAKTHLSVIAPVLLPEQDVLQAISEGNEPAFESVFRLHYAPLCRYAGQLLPDADEAEEEVQAMFVAVWEKRADLRITSSLKSYLFQAVHNRCLNRLRHQSVRDDHRRQVQFGGAGTAESPVQALLADELAERVRAAIQRLPEQCRLVFTLSRYEELSYAEIAEQLGISPKTVENQIGKALRILRGELREYLPFLLLWFIPHN
jgi:RNA polymerase sigma-70 factor (ECF subfamily)